jgi:hypothetical protein
MNYEVEQPSEIYAKDFKEMLNIEKYFPNLDDVSSFLNALWVDHKGNPLHKFIFETPNIHTKDYNEAKDLLDAFLKDYWVAYRTLMKSEDFALLDILKYNYGFTLYDVVVSFFDAEYFLRRFFDPKIKLAPKQREMLFNGSYEDLVSIRSSTASGKSFINARLGFWWISTHRNSKLVMTAPTARQAINILWSEFKQIYYQFKEKYPEYTEEMMTGEPKTVSFYQGIWNVNDKEEIWQALCFSVRDYRPETLQGFHSKFMMVIIDEASGVEDALFEAIDRILTGSQISKYYLISNPTRTTGFFYNTQLPDSLFKKIHISAFDSPNTILEFLEKKMYNAFYSKKKRLKLQERPYKLLNPQTPNAKIPSLEYISGLMTVKDIVKYIHLYGRDSDKFRIDILGDFPRNSGNYLCSREDIENCRNNTKYPEALSLDVQFGIDVATGSTEAKTAFAYRCGKALLRTGTSDAKTPDQIIQDFKLFVEQCQLPDRFDLKKAPIVVDRTGIGYALYERLKDNGYNIDGFQGTEEPVDFKNKERYSNRRAEGFMELVNGIKNCEIYLVNTPAIFVLQSIGYTTDKKGKIILNPKKEIFLPDKEKYLLDVIDAISMAFTPTLKKNNNWDIKTKFFDNIAKLWER